MNEAQERQPRLFKKVQASVAMVALKDIAPWHTGGARSATTAAIRTLGFSSAVLLRAISEATQVAYTANDGAANQGPFRYAVIDGARRLDDARNAGIEAVPATILPASMNDLEVAAHRSCANLSRRSNLMHEAEALHHLYLAFCAQGVREQDAPRVIATCLGIKVGIVRQRLHLMALPSPLRDGVKVGAIAGSVASRIANLSEVRQDELVARYLEHGQLSAKDVHEVRTAKRRAAIRALSDALFTLPPEGDAVASQEASFTITAQALLSAGYTEERLCERVKQISRATVAGVAS